MEAPNLSIFKVGIGPSSSHTMGPIAACAAFCERIRANKTLAQIERIKVTLYGSLSLTGRGHLSDEACILGLNALSASDITPRLKTEVLDLALKRHIIKLCGEKEIEFIYERDIVFSDEFLSYHENAMRVSGYGSMDDAPIDTEVYYSTGGGFILADSDIGRSEDAKECHQLEYNFNTASELIALCERHNKSIAEISMLRECELNSKEYVEGYCLNIFEVMVECMRNGMDNEDELIPGAIKLKRRANKLREKLRKNPPTDPLGVMDYISLYALSISEENASGGKVVTSPTNGACGVVPATMQYINRHLKELSRQEIIDFLLVAMAIGSLYKKNASISGAEAGCQAEIGSASSMAAAAAAAIMGADIYQTCCAAEIAMEHHLGLTCDPIEGLVQVPCIERNIFGALKAIAAMRVALDRESSGMINLDDVIATMFCTGKDMDRRYKETSLGGLAYSYRKHMNC